MYPVKGTARSCSTGSGDGVRGQGEVQGGGAVDELLVGLSKRGQANGKEKQRTKIRFPHALARRSIYFQ